VNQTKQVTLFYKEKVIRVSCVTVGSNGERLRCIEYFI